MQKIINWKIYDTEKSELITNCWIHNIKVNLDELTEIIYKTKNKEYLLYSYVWNIIHGDNKLWEELKILNIYDIMKWFEKRQKHFDENQKKQFFKEFWKYFIEA